MDMGISGRVAMVTGAGRGIGAEICRALAAEGVKIAVNDLFTDRAEEAAEAIRAGGGEAIGVAFDVTEYDAVAAGVGKVVEAFGSVDILVNNAGIPADGGDAIPSTASWRATARPGPHYGPDHVRRDEPQLRQHRRAMERRWGRIVNVISTRRVESRDRSYSMAKAVCWLHEGAGEGERRHCISANCVSPAMTVTDATREWMRRRRADRAATRWRRVSASASQATSRTQ
jgi:NAD(P)-dependent dehydrogenase (short-subunit alcohol dehydrogenase family)